MTTIQYPVSNTTYGRHKLAGQACRNLVGYTLFSLAMLTGSYASAQPAGAQPPVGTQESSGQSRAAPRQVGSEEREPIDRKPTLVATPQASEAIRYQFSLAGEGVRVIAWQGQQAETIAAVALDGQRHQLLEYQQTVYVACDLRGVAVIDVSNPRSPVLRGYVGAGSPVLGIGMVGSALVASLAGGSLLRFNVSDPVHPLLQQSPTPVPQIVQVRDAQLHLSAEELDSPMKPRTPKRRGVGMTIAGASIFGGLYIWPLILAPFVDGTLAIPVVGPIVSLARSGSSGWASLAIVDSVGQAVGFGLLLGGIAQLNSAAPTTVSQRIQFLPYGNAGGGGMLAVGKF